MNNVIVLTSLFFRSIFAKTIGKIKVKGIHIAILFQLDSLENGQSVLQHTIRREFHPRPVVPANKLQSGWNCEGSACSGGDNCDPLDGEFIKGSGRVVI
jgi:hypothetical protein